MPTELPRARVEVKGAAGHLERAAAETRERARAAGRMARPIARGLAVVAGFTLACGVLAAIVTPCHVPTSARASERAELRVLQQNLRQLEVELDSLRTYPPERPVFLISRQPGPAIDTGAAAPTRR